MQAFLRQGAGAAEGDESARKRSSDTVDTAGAPAAAASTADSSVGTTGVTKQARDLSLHEDSGDEPELPGALHAHCAPLLPAACVGWQQLLVISPRLTRPDLWMMHT